RDRGDLDVPVRLEQLPAAAGVHAQRAEPANPRGRDDRVRGRVRHGLARHGRGRHDLTGARHDRLRRAAEQVRRLHRRSGEAMTPTEDHLMTDLNADTDAEHTILREAAVDIDTHRALGTVSDDIYGHFLESAFFGNIEGGVFDEGSELSIQEPGLLNGMRADVLDLSRSCVRGRSAGQAGTSPPPTTGRTASAPATSVPNGASWPGARSRPTVSAPTSSWPGARPSTRRPTSPIPRVTSTRPCAGWTTPTGSGTRP